MVEATPVVMDAAVDLASLGATINNVDANREEAFAAGRNEPLHTIAALRAPARMRRLGEIAAGLGRDRERQQGKKQQNGGALQR